MTALQAAVLGLVEGITEFLPVSSTGHLLVAQRLLGLPQDEASDAYAIVIQAGAIAAVFVLYTARLRTVAEGLIGRNPEGLRLLAHLVMAFVPAAIAGLLFDDYVESILLGPWPVVVAWVVGGLALLAFGKHLQRGGGTDLPALTVRTAVLVGLFQCLALWPGTSRSLVTLVGGLVVGLSLPAAIEFSFLLGLVTLSAATAFTALKHGDALLATYDLLPIGIGFVTAFASAVAAVRFMVGWLQSHGFALFGWWRVLAGAAVAAWLWTGPS